MKPKPRKEKWKTVRRFEVRFKYFNSFNDWVSWFATSSTHAEATKQAAKRQLDKNLYRSIQIFEVETRERRIK